MRNVFYFSKKVRLFSQNDVLFLFYFLINPAGTTANYHPRKGSVLAIQILNLGKTAFSREFHKLI